MHYTPHVLLAFDSVEHISRNVKNGWMIRYMHCVSNEHFSRPAHYALSATVNLVLYS